MTTAQPLTLDILRAAVSGSAVAFRLRARLQPAGGVGDKVFPPTYAAGERATTKYAFEERVVDGAPVATVLLDSVQSQANRVELALLEAWEAGKAHFPVIGVDFTAAPETADIGLLTTLQAPHRIADALLRDAVTDDGTPFRAHPIGLAYTNARVHAATPVYAACPTALIFGVWDSTGPKGGLGAKFQRALVSEIVGIDAKAGVKTSSRLDPAAIEGVFIYERATDATDWTANPDEAALDKGKPKPFSRSGSGGDKGKASAANHSNIPPTIETATGGVTVAYAEQTAVLSLVALRRLRFPTTVDGSVVPAEGRRAVEGAARTALAALGLLGLALQRQQGQDLRSRCLLVPEGKAKLELLDGDGGATTYALDIATLTEILAAAHAEAEAVGMGWQREPLRLKPADKLVDLIRRSRAQQVEAGGAA